MKSLKLQICISRARAIFPSAGYLTEMVPTAGFAGSFFNSLPLESSAKVTNMLQIPRTLILFLLRHSDESHQMSDSFLIKFAFSVKRCKISARIFFNRYLFSVCRHSFRINVMLRVESISETAVCLLVYFCYCSHSKIIL